jgi:hypothetical protein
VSLRAKSGRFAQARATGAANIAHVTLTLGLRGITLPGATGL